MQTVIFQKKQKNVMAIDVSQDWTTTNRDSHAPMDILRMRPSQSGCRCTTLMCIHKREKQEKERPKHE